jgi:hypothetical protein
MPRKLNLVKCVEAWANVYAIKIDSLKTDATKPPARAFQRNLWRVYALMMFPAVAVSAIATIEHVSYEKKLEYRKQIQRHKITERELATIISQALDALNEQRDSIIKAGGQKAIDFQQRETEFGFGTLEDLLGNTALILGADAWLAGQISGIWTAFEALAEEIWIAALNAHPRGLAELKGGKKGAASDDKKIDLHLLQRYGYDLSKNMGTILSRRFSFDRLEDIRRAYAEAAFDDDDLPFQEIFADKSLDVLALTRQVIVHNGGLIDEAFLRRRSDLPPELLADVGQPIPLNGEIVASLIAPVMQLGWDLIVAVDKWLLKNTEAQQ